MRRLAVVLAVLAASVSLAAAQDTGGLRELLGQLGGRAALMRLYVNLRADGSSRLSGDYLILPTLQLRYLEGERSKELGVTFLKEGNSPILYGRPADATLQGTWGGGMLKGTRYAPGGQARERFEFSEKFPGMGAYGAHVQCEAAAGRYGSRLSYDVEAGRVKRLEWHSRIAPAGHTCELRGLEQQPFAGGLRLASGRCRVTLRDLGDYVRVSAERCGEFCGSEAYLEPLLVDRGGGCQLLRLDAR
ncbi:MAG: hypothetical protein ACREVQ_02090 [Burkholderiales bacterium]